MLYIGICNNTLLSFFKQYTEGGLARLNEINFNQTESDAGKMSSRKNTENKYPVPTARQASHRQDYTGV